jgi:hypothetical protein
MDFDIELFGNKKLSDLLKDIYDNQKKKDRQISLLIADLKPHIQNINDATAIVPVIKDFMEVSIKNDEHLIKLAAIVQRLAGKGTDENSSFLTDEEKQELLRGIEEISKEHEEIKQNVNNENRSSEDVNKWD